MQERGPEDAARAHHHRSQHKPVHAGLQDLERGLGDGQPVGGVDVGGEVDVHGTEDERREDDRKPDARLGATELCHEAAEQRSSDHALLEEADAEAEEEGVGEVDGPVGDDLDALGDGVPDGQDHHHGGDGDGPPDGLPRDLAVIVAVGEELAPAKDEDHHDGDDGADELVDEVLLPVEAHVVRDVVQKRRGDEDDARADDGRDELAQARVPPLLGKRQGRGLRDGLGRLGLDGLLVGNGLGDGLGGDSLGGLISVVLVHELSDTTRGRRERRYATLAAN